jgi:hypothetical protein
MAQRYNLSDTIPNHDAPPSDVDDLVQHALAGRPDVQAASVQVKAADLVRKAASAEYYPSVDVSANYGAIGITPTNEAHGTFTVAGGISFPIFRSGRIRADIDQADAALALRKAEYEDIKGRAEQDVRTALLDSSAAAQQVKVADSNRTLAADTLTQARDRFRSGVSDTVELVPVLRGGHAPRRGDVPIPLRRRSEHCRRPWLPSLQQSRDSLLCSPDGSRQTYLREVKCVKRANVILFRGGDRFLRLHRTTGLSHHGNGRPMGDRELQRDAIVADARGTKRPYSRGRAGQGL